MTDKLYSVVGTSKFNGQMKVRWSTDLVTRFKMLHKGGHTDIELFDLPQELTKQQATEWLAEQDAIFDKLLPEAQTAVQMKLDEYHVMNKSIVFSLDEIAKRPTIEVDSDEDVAVATEKTPEVS